MRLCLYEDRPVAGLAPFAIARPVFDSICGLGTVHDGLVRHFRPDSVGYMIRKPLVAALRRREPDAPVNEPRWLCAGPTWMVNARWIPGKPFSRPLPRSPFLALCEGEIAYALLSADQLAGVAPDSLEDCLDDWRGLLPNVAIDGHISRSAGGWIAHSAGRIAADFPMLDACRNLPAGVVVLGSSEQLYIDPTATVEPMVLLDTTRGPIVLGAGANVRAFSRIEGPCAVGAGAEIAGATLRGATVGPNCRIAGTLDRTVVQGYSEIGPGCVFTGSYLGEGVHAGPNTMCEVGAGPILVGDYAHLAAGVILDRSTTIGAFARISATGWNTPHNVPAFGVVTRDGIEPDERANKHLHEVADEMTAKGRAFDRIELEIYRELANGEADVGHRMRPLPFRRAA